MRKGNIAIIDGVATLLIVILLCGVVAYCEPDEGLRLLKEGMEKESLRVRFYNILFTGGIQSLIMGGSSHLEVGGLIMDSNPPSNGTYLKFFISDGKGVREFYVYEKG